MADRYEAVVIGSGFGGGIAACRLGKRWPGKVAVFERGRRYPMGSFPRSPHDFARNFWNLPDEGRSRPSKLVAQEAHGLFDIRNYKRMDAVLCAGLGGGSLIYANVFMEPPDQVFDERWPASCKKAALAPYYRVAKEVLGARPVPTANGDPRRQLVRTRLFEEFARQVGRDSKLVDLNVFFGNDHAKPLPIGHQEKNRYGAIQTSCTYCGECDVGCNTHSKNTIDLNYLFVAENRYQARVLTEHLVDKLVPVNERDEDDASADGSHGYRVYYYDLTRSGPRSLQAVVSQRVVVSAGTLGSSELLLRNRDVHHTLPRLSPRLGQRFSGNGDFLSFVLGAREAAEPNYGPVITQRIDYNLFQDFDPQRAFLLEDASYPTFAAWFVEGVKPGALRLSAVWRWMRDAWGRYVSGMSPSSLGYAFEDLLSGDLSYNASVLLCMGLDRSNGTLTLDGAGRVSLDWPQDDSRPLYDAILAAGRRFCEVVGGRHFLALPTWYRPFRRNVTVHSLGGCVLADDPAQGVTRADPGHLGQVFGYEGLYVVDGAIVPTAVGANPTATISALAERVMEGITGQAPDASL